MCMWRLDNMFTKQPMGHWKIKLKLSGGKRKWKHNDPKYMGSNFSKEELKRSSKRKFTATKLTSREQNSQINHLIYTQRN